MKGRVDPLRQHEIEEVRAPGRPESPWRAAREAVDEAITVEGFRAEQRVFGSGALETTRSTRDEWFEKLKRERSVVTVYLSGAVVFADEFV